MRYRPLGRTGQYVSEICLGTMTFSGGAGFWRAIGALDQKASTALVGRAIEAGVNFIDTANVYSEGQSEIQLGQALRDLGVKREDVVIATKVRGRMGPGPNAVGLSRGHIMDQIAASLKRLGLDHVDLYQIHGFDPVTPFEETLAGARRLRVARARAHDRLLQPRRLADHEGARHSPTSAASRASRRCRPTIRSPAASSSARSCRSSRIRASASWSWSPLAGGFLSGKFTREKRGDNDSRRTTFDFPPVDKERAYDIVDAMAPIAKAHGASVARVALAWLLQRKGVMSVIIGAKTVEQLDDNLAAAELTLSAEEIATLDEVSALKPEYPGWMLARQAEGRVPAAKA